MKSDPTVLQAKRYGVYTCPLGMTLREVARRMVEEDVSALIVVNGEGYLEGIITHTDLLRAHCAREDWGSKAVEEHMTTPVITAGVDDRLSRIAELLLDKRIHRVVVVRDEGGRQRPVAVLSESDLVYYFSKES